VVQGRRGRRPPHWTPYVPRRPHWTLSSGNCA